MRTSTALSSGLATWIPAIEHESGLFVIEATAGSGKTQLALALMRQAHAAKQRCAYVCFNRALADHMLLIAPYTAQIMTFHEACVEQARRAGLEPDFSQPGIYDQLAEQLAAATPRMTPRWDLRPQRLRDPGTRNHCRPAHAPLHRALRLGRQPAVDRG